ncbi:uncharacterized protein LOC142606157 [Castanea sativa]|uniref:uncharacterized protein LOC142606157 n=1 Tax=Castanea sativa TaxID=21020 RepID=UPI003F64FF1A
MNIEEQRMVTKPVEELEEVNLDDSRPERTTRIGTLASQTVRQALALFLKENQDVFAWSHEDMPGIDSSVMVHWLNLSPSFSPVRQKKRVFAPKRDRVIAEEVRKLQEADFIHEVYVDDILVKSVRESDHMRDLQETFDTLRSYKMKLNPSKCAFGVTAGKFLGFMVSQRGIKVSPEKVKTIMELAPPRMVKEVQSLNSKIAALSRFVSRAMDKCLPFFRTLRRSFEWTDECQKAFDDLKGYLSAPSLLSPSMSGEELFLYLAVSSVAISAALIREEDKIQRPVNGSYECKNERMKRYLEEVKGRANNLQIKLVQIPREENQDADRLGKVASAEPMIIPDQVLSFIQLSSLLNGTSMQEVISEHCWMAPITAYLKDCKFPDNKEVARKLKVKATRFVLIKDVLYKRGFSRPYLRCLDHNEADYVMREVYEGVCDNHSGSRGLDIMGPFPTAVRQLKFLVVGIDYFTKWVEAEALATITEKNIRIFIWRNIIYRYGILRVLVSDNGK